MQKLAKRTQEQAAEMLAGGRYDFTEIAGKLELTRKTLYMWRQDRAFMQRVDELKREFAQAAMKRGIARRDYRLKTLADLHSDLLSVIEARAKDMADVPGGDTGLLVRSPVISAGTIVDYEYKVDIGLIQQLRGLQEQAAKELGQLVEKHEHKVMSIKDMSDEQLLAFAAELESSSGDGLGEGLAELPC